MAQINATLASSVTYSPTANYGGAATLTMTTSDGGNTGTGGTQTDVDTVSINVVAVADTPQLIGPAAYTAWVAGTSSASTTSGVSQANLETAVGLTAGTLDGVQPGTECRRRHQRPGQCRRIRRWSHQLPLLNGQRHDRGTSVGRSPTARTWSAKSTKATTIR